MEAYATIVDILAQFSPITLEEMSSIRLMKRMDSKFLTNVTMLVELLKRASGNYFIQEVNGKRMAHYATTYWDNPNKHSMFRIHHCGHRPRTKVRVRTYLDSNLSFLEIKKKDNHGKTSKKRMSVPSFDSVKDERLGEDFLKELTGITFDQIIPVISNHFQRITLVNKAKTERLTIDFDLHFYNWETKMEQIMEKVVIIELKRDGNQNSPILPILRELRIKPSGFSKYCIGTVVTNKGIRHNLFKEKLRYVQKIAKEEITAVEECF